MKKLITGDSHLTTDQRNQVERQWQNMQHDRLEIDIVLSGHGDILQRFVVQHGVWNPAITSARYHASYLNYNNRRLFAGKLALDMGTGTGIMGVVMGLCGAARVVLSDISPVAVRNTVENVERYGLTSTANVRQGDLFACVPERFDFIVFNHPFFCGIPAEGDTIAASMLAPEDLIHRFLREAPAHLNPSGMVMMPFYTRAGAANDPALRGPEHGFTVAPCFRTVSRSGLQKGEILIYELRRQ